MLQMKRGKRAILLMMAMATTCLLLARVAMAHKSLDDEEKELAAAAAAAAANQAQNVEGEAGFDATAYQDSELNRIAQETEASR